MRRDDVDGVEVDGYKSRERPKRKWMDCLKEDLARQGVNIELTSDRG